jgi:hypothetical protein
LTLLRACLLTSGTISVPSTSMSKPLSCTGASALGLQEGHS